MHKSNLYAKHRNIIGCGYWIVHLVKFRFVWIGVFFFLLLWKSFEAYYLYSRGKKEKFLKIHYVWACNIIHRKGKHLFAKTQFECAFNCRFISFILSHSLSFLYLNIIYIASALHYPVLIRLFIHLCGENVAFHLSIAKRSNETLSLSLWVCKFSTYLYNV